MIFVPWPFLAFVAALVASPEVDGQIVKVGPVASYVDRVPDGLRGASSITNCASNDGGQSTRFVPARMKHTERVRFPFPTHQWWSSALWRRCLDVAETAGSEVMYGFPLAMRAFPWGLALSYPQEQQIIQSPFVSFIRDYKNSFYPWDLVVTAEGMPADGEARVDGFSDLHVRLVWTAGGSSRGFSVNMGRGWPFVFVESQGDAVLKLVVQGRITVTANDVGTLAFSVQTFRGADVFHHYALYFTEGAQWTQTFGWDGNGAPQTTLLSSGCAYFSLAVLPTPDASNVAMFKYYHRISLRCARTVHIHPIIGRSSAHNFIVSGSVSWKYNQAVSSADVTFQYQTEDKLGGQSAPPILALLPHQWKNMHPDDTGKVRRDISYNSPRGTLYAIHATSFTVRFPYTGVLPGLPVVDKSPQVMDRTRQLLLSVTELGRNLYMGEGDSYWFGKRLGKVADLVFVAQELGETAVRDQLLDDLKAGLSDWFRAEDSTKNFFYYDANVGSLIGYSRMGNKHSQGDILISSQPSSYGSDTDLNDHHFHYGYFIKAAAILALFDEAWTASYKDFVNLLIADTANTDPVKEPRFPRLRQLEPYVGYHYASGHAAFGSGNNQESSSEAMNFNAALVLWGEATGQDQIRDLGVYMYASETAAIEQYWFDMDKHVFPTGYNAPYSSLIWDDGGSYAIFWGPYGAILWIDEFTYRGIDVLTRPHPEEIHGINMLPVTGGSLYLGRHPDKMHGYYTFMLDQKGGVAESMWQDIIWKWQAMYDAPFALTKFLASEYPVEDGTTAAHTYFFLSNLQQLGKVDTNTSSDLVSFVAFSGGQWVAYNAQKGVRTVNVSNGRSFSVPGRSFMVMNAQQGVPTSGTSAGPSSTATVTDQPTSEMTPTRTLTLTSASEVVSFTVITLTSITEETPTATFSTSITEEIPTATISPSVTEETPTSTTTSAEMQTESTSSTIAPEVTTTSSLTATSVTFSEQVPTSIETSLTSSSDVATSTMTLIPVETTISTASEWSTWTFVAMPSTTEVASWSSTISTSASSSSFPTNTPAPFPPPADVPTSLDGSCGQERGLRCPDGTCCSPFSWCGTSPEHCGAGCQPLFGACGETPATRDSPVTTTLSLSANPVPLPTSTVPPSQGVTLDGSCGGGKGWHCRDNACCSQYNWCGMSLEHCGQGCQPGFGSCISLPSSIVAEETPEYDGGSSMDESQDGSCGWTSGLRCGTDGACCSQFDWCGSTEVHCGAGCQPAFGECAK